MSKSAALLIFVILTPVFAFIDPTPTLTEVFRLNALVTPQQALTIPAAADMISDLSIIHGRRRPC